MTKEEFLKRYCPEYENYSDIFETYQDFFTFESVDFSSLDYIDDYQDVETYILKEISKTIVEKLCKLCFPQEGIFDKFCDDIYESIDNGWDFLTFRTYSSIAVNLTQFIDEMKTICDYLTLNYNTYQIEHVLNDTYDFKFYVYNP